jgi:hypothetical protein
MLAALEWNSSVLGWALAHREPAGPDDDHIWPDGLLIADPQGKLSFVDNHLDEYNTHCAQDFVRHVTVEATDEALGAKTTATMPAVFFCNNFISGGDFNGGCR